MGSCCCAGESEVNIVQVHLNSRSGMLERLTLEREKTDTIESILTSLEQRNLLTRKIHELVVINENSKRELLKTRLQQLSTFNNQTQSVQLYVQAKDQLEDILRESIPTTAPSTKIAQQIFQPRTNSQKKNLYVILESQSGVVRQRVEKAFEENTTVEQVLQESAGLFKQPLHSIEVWTKNQERNIVMEVDRKTPLSKLLGWSKDTVRLWLEKPALPLEVAEVDLVQRKLSVSSFASTLGHIPVIFQSRTGLLDRRVELSVLSDKTVNSLLDHLTSEKLVKVSRHTIKVNDKNGKPVDPEFSILELSPNMKRIVLFLERR